MLGGGMQTCSTVAALCQGNIQVSILRIPIYWGYFFIVLSHSSIT